METGMSKQGWT